MEPRIVLAGERAELDEDHRERIPDRERHGRGGGRCELQRACLAIDAGIDPETEPKTLVEFHLTDEGDGTLLKVVETGFDNVPHARRKRAFLMNTGGWESQLENIAKYLEKENAS